MAKGVYIGLILIFSVLIFGCAGPSYNQQVIEDDLSDISGNAVEVIIEEPAAPVVDTTEYKPQHTIYYVNVTSFGFEPQSIDISVGDSVIWVSVDQTKPTNVLEVFDIGDMGKRTAFKSGRMFYGDEFGHTYKSTGRYAVINLAFSSETERDQTMGTVFVH